MRDTTTAVLFALVCLGQLIQSVYSLECYTCTNVTDVKLCTTKQTCGSAESCFVTSVHSEALYDMGCLENTKCANRVTLGTGGVIGRRQVTRCHECCSTDLCNAKLCDYSATTSCSDDPSIDCARMESLFAICQISQQAHDLCPRFCGLCKNETQGGPSTVKYLQTTADPALTTTDSDCKDLQNNCDRYDDAGCRGIFENWARAHCAKRCGYCGDGRMTIANTASTTPKTSSVVVISSTTFELTGVKSPVRGTCYFKNTTFSEGEHWKDTCRYDCQCVDTENNTALCTDVCPHFTSLPPYCTIRQKLGDCCPKLDCGNETDITGQTSGVNVTAYANSTDCQDTIPGCEYYENIVCRGIYEPWARAHCALRCGYCGYSAPCVDRLTYCNAYELRTACRDYPGWARYNCKKSCGLCA